MAKISAYTTSVVHDKKRFLRIGVQAGNARVVAQIAYKDAKPEHMVLLLKQLTFSLEDALKKHDGQAG